MPPTPASISTTDDKAVESLQNAPASLLCSPNLLLLQAPLTPLNVQLEGWHSEIKVHLT